MFAIRELERLTEQKNALLAKSDENRRELAANCERLAPAIAIIDTATSIVQRWWPIIAAAAPVLGFLTMRRKQSGKFDTIWRVWEMVSKFAGLWRERKEASRE